MDATRQRILPRAEHTRADREVAYRAMHFAAELLLHAGASAILDAPYGHAGDREELRRIATGHEKWIECRVSPETAVARFRQRGPDAVRRDLTSDLVSQTAREFPYTGGGLVLDTEALSFEECLRRIEDYL
jgi:predicted kinase